MTIKQEEKEVSHIIKKAQRIIQKQKEKKTPYQHQSYIRDLIDIQNKIIREHIDAKSNRTQANKIAFIITNINYILGGNLKWQ